MEVPTCALNRRSSTVLVRIMDTCEFCKRHGVRAWLYTEDTKTSYCELCSKVTSLGQICAPGSASSKRGPSKWIASSKKVRLYAASCLLLLVGGFPSTEAAPRIFTTTEKIKLSTIAFEAKRAYEDFSSHNDVYMRAYLWNGTETFAQVLDHFSWNYSQLQHVSWFEKDMLPECKNFGSAADEACLHSAILSKNQVQLQHLQKLMYRGLNYVTAAFERMTKVMLDNETRFADLNKKMLESAKGLKKALASLKISLKENDLYDDSLDVLQELPEYTKLEKKLIAVTYRDTLNFVEYFQQFYTALA